MALYDLANMNCATVGTGSLTLSTAVSGYLTFVLAGVPDGTVVTYGIADLIVSGVAGAREIGRGTVGGTGTTLTRTVLKSTNANAALNLSGASQVFITSAAEDFLQTLSIGLTAADQASARANTSAAATEAGAERGILVNPFMEVSQSNGVTAVTVTNGVYTLDQWQAFITGASVTATVQQVTDPFSGTAGFKRFRSGKVLTIGVAQAVLLTGDFLYEQQPVEGTFWKNLGWGTADAASVDVVIICQASVTGTYSLAIRNGASNRSYATPVALTANTPTAVLITIPGDQAGTWSTDTTLSAQVSLSVATGATFQAAANNAWSATNTFGVNGGGTNLAATASATLKVAYMNVFPTGVIPWTTGAAIDLTHLVNMKRRFDDELRSSQRYFEIGSAFVQSPVAGAFGASMPYRSLKRTTTPARLYTGVVYGSGSGLNDLPSYVTGDSTLAFNFTASAVSGTVNFIWSSNARM